MRRCPYRRVRLGKCDSTLTADSNGDFCYLLDPCRSTRAPSGSAAACLRSLVSIRRTVARSIGSGATSNSGTSDSPPRHRGASDRARQNGQPLAAVRLSIVSDGSSTVEPSVDTNPLRRHLSWMVSRSRGSRWSADQKSWPRVPTVGPSLGTRQPGMAVAEGTDENVAPHAAHPSRAIALSRKSGFLERLREWKPVARVKTRG
jgi:hypothetical protein